MGFEDRLKTLLAAKALVYYRAASGAIMDIDSRLKAIIADQLGIPLEEVQDSSRFVEDLGSDSLDKVELIMAMEEEFEIEIPDEDAENMATVGEAVAYIRANT